MIKVAFTLKMRMKSILFCLLLVLIATAGYYGHAFYSFLSGVQQPTIVKGQHEDGKPLNPKSEIPVWGGKERVNILLLGIDRRDLRPDEQPRSDSMILVSIDPVGKTYDLFSILRDTYVEIPGYGSSRINAALAEGGPELAMETVSGFVGLPVDRYVITDFEGFKHLIDAVGGVEIDVEKNMRYRDPSDKGLYDINLKKGLQRLDGDKALQYVRFRHDAMSDYTRTERQRKLLAALAEQLQKGTTLLQLPAILDSVRPYVQTNMSSGDMLKLSALALQLKSEQAGQYQLPPMGAFRESNRGGSVLLPDRDQVKKYVQEQLNRTKPVTQTE
jgi:LCP family protein required for cell wall assembly